MSTIGEIRKVQMYPYFVVIKKCLYYLSLFLYFYLSFLSQSTPFFVIQKEILVS